MLEEDFAVDDVGDDLMLRAQRGRVGSPVDDRLVNVMAPRDIARDLLLMSCKSVPLRQAPA